MKIVENDEYLIHRVKFYLTLSLQIPAILLSLFIFAFFITNAIHRRKLQNQALVILFIVNFIQLLFDLPMFLNFLRLNRISPATGTYCKWWMFLESSFDAANVFLVGIMSIQRHILIFQPNLLLNRCKCYILYYLPLALCIVYPVIFYMGSVVFYRCDDIQWNFTLNACVDTICYLSNNEILAMFDWVMNITLPVIIVLTANILLVVRVIKQKNRRQQAISWSKQRRMTLQLLSISSIYLITWLPNVVSGIMQQICPSNYLYYIQENFISDLTYLICLLVPWISVGLLPDFMKWMIRLFRRLKKRPNFVAIIK